ncbi:unnamed protein product [marine sediment metagenome]|uniref:Uncharacterized protein n=1 Tax=marine sediment metagenome TaxID=412755 RepID=X0RPC8_9ZZZZ
MDEEIQRLVHEIQKKMQYLDAEESFKFLIMFNCLYYHFNIHPDGYEKMSELLVNGINDSLTNIKPKLNLFKVLSEYFEDENKK